MGAELRLVGAQEMINRLKKIELTFPDHFGAALRKEAEIEATECKKRCPVYVGPTGPGYPIPGVLRASIHVEGPFREGRRIWCDIVAGGAAGAYAMVQHEELSFFHVVGQAKYIESVIMESRRYMPARVAASLQELVG